MKIGIVGSGMVGATAAYAMVMRGVGREIVLIDINEKRSEAEANDILHAVPFADPLRIRAGGYEDLKGCRLVILAAGVSQKPGETRLDVLKRNAAVFQQILPNILKHTVQSVLVVATNPVDIMTHLTAHYAREFDVPGSRVFGTGTMLDTARFRSLLGEYTGVDAQHVHGYVIGEHGDSEVLTWSLTTIGAMHLKDYCQRQNIQLDENLRQDIDQQVRNAAYEIIEGKGATYYGIGSALAKLADVILHDQRSILTVSTPTRQVEGVSDASVSLPRLIGGDGILATLPLSLDAHEKGALHESATVVKEAIGELV